MALLHFFTTVHNLYLQIYIDREVDCIFGRKGHLHVDASLTVHIPAFNFGS